VKRYSVMVCDLIQAPWTQHTSFVDVDQHALALDLAKAVLARVPNKAVWVRDNTVSATGQ
jgi:hypothetical protein